jgi:hypothetical protein
VTKEKNIKNKKIEPVGTPGLEPSKRRNKMSDGGGL